MEVLGSTSERSEIGQALHLAETAVGIRRRSIAELVCQDPIDHEQLNMERVALVASRLTRNALRRDLEFVKARDAKVPIWW